MVPTTVTYFLASGALSSTAPTGTAPATLLAGGSPLTFDRSVATGTVLSGTPVLVVDLDVRKAQGNGGGQGQLVATLQDCTTAAGPCADVSTATASVGGHGAGNQQETVVLAAVNTAVLPGHVLRLSLALNSQGNAAQALLAFGASRLSLTAAPPP